VRKSESNGSEATQRTGGCKVFVVVGRTRFSVPYDSGNVKSGWSGKWATSDVVALSVVLDKPTAAIRSFWSKFKDVREW
jgi:hypothetical protein